MTYLALLRGINVGGNTKVDMKKLKASFESLGFSDVTTYINSGNVIFTSPKTSAEKLVSMIETVIKKDFGFAVPVVVRDLTQMQKVTAALSPSWENDGEQKTDILFLWDTYDSPKSLDLLTLTKGVDDVSYVSGAILWHIDRAHYSKSGMHKFIGTPLYKHMTARNINTVRKLTTMMEEKNAAH